MRRLAAAVAILVLQTADGQVVARVNGRSITLAEVDAVIDGRPRSPTPMTPSARRQLRMQVAGGLIDDTLLRDFLKKNAPPVPEARVDEQVAALKKIQEARGVTLEDYYRQTGQTEAEVRSNIRAVMGLDAHLARTTSEAALKAYYEANKPFFDKTQVRLSHVVVRVPRGDRPGRAAAKAKLLKLRPALTTAGAFAAAARKHSQCPSATAGGDIGWVTRKWAVDEPIAAAAFSLEKGQVSGVVETDIGVHLIRVADRRPGPGSTFLTAKEDVRACHAEEARQALLARLRGRADVTITLP